MKKRMQVLIKNSAVKILLPLVLGSLFSLGFAPIDFWPFTLLSVGGIWLFIRKRPDNLFLSGWLYGLGVFGVGVSWISSSMEVSDTPFLISVVLTSIFCFGFALFFAVQFWLYNRLKLDSTTLNSLIFIALWLLFEWIRGWLFTGFPWLFAGYITTETWLFELAPLIGVYGLTLIVVGIPVLVVDAIVMPNKGKIITASLVTLTVISASIILQSIQWTSPTGETIDTAVIQGNIDQRSKWLKSSINPTFDRYSNMSQPHLDADLIVWPEAAITLLREDATEFTDRLEYWGTTTNTGFIVGILSDIESEDGEVHYYNSAIGIGKASGEYHKLRMVPFGEYVPMASLLRPMIDFFNLPMSILESGTPAREPLKLNNTSVGALICYEIAYPAMSREAALSNSFMITLSNDAWFGMSFGPYQHLQIARMRAKESGRPIIRATQDGVSAIIDDQGTLVVQAPKSAQKVIRTKIAPTKGKTPYLLFGHLWLIFLATSILVYAKFIALKRNPTLHKMTNEQHHL